MQLDDGSVCLYTGIVYPSIMYLSIMYLYIPFCIHVLGEIFRCFLPLDPVVWTLLNLELRV